MSESIFIPPNPPIAFAIMRNAHESFRNALKDIKTLYLQGDGSLDAFKAAYSEICRAIGVHMVMEDEFVFPLLASVGDDKTLADHFKEEHQNDSILTEAIVKHISESNSLPDAELFQQWCAAQVHHLEGEESDATAVTMKTGDTPAKRGAAVCKFAVTPSIVRNKAEFHWFVGWNISSLTRCGSSKNTPTVAVRVFAHGLQSASTVSQWAELREIVKVNTTSEIWAAMVEEYRIDGDGHNADDLN